MSTIIEIIKSLPSLKYSGGVSQVEISKAENELNLHFSEEYKIYLMQFGQIEAKGIEMSGLSSKQLTSVVNMTLDERKNPDFPKDHYVIEDIGMDGLIYTQDATGTVYEIIPGHKPRIFSNTLLDYIKSLS